MSKKSKNEIECDECGHTCTITHKEKQTISHCPFCGEPATPKENNERPLLNNFDDLDSFNEEDYYEDEDEVEE